MHYYEMDYRFDSGLNIDGYVDGQQPLSEIISDVQRTIEIDSELECCLITLKDTETAREIVTLGVRSDSFDVTWY